MDDHTDALSDTKSAGVECDMKEAVWKGVTFYRCACFGETFDLVEALKACRKS